MDNYLIDTHCHLDFSPLSVNVKGVIKEAEEAGVKKLITVGASLARSEKVVKIVGEYENVWGTVGIHPHEVKILEELEEEKIREKLLKLGKTEKIVAIGECGLDFLKIQGEEEETKKEQKKLFRLNIGVAKILGLPLVVHSREAFWETIEILKEENFPFEKIVFHCWTYDKEKMKVVCNLRAFVSFTGIVTYKNADSIREAVLEVPESQFFLETDAPFLAPQEKRGETNKPAYLSYIALKVAEIREKELEEIAFITTRNVLKFFNLDKK